LIGRGACLIVRVAFEAQFQIGILLQQFDDFAEDLARVRKNYGLAGVKRECRTPRRGRSSWFRRKDLERPRQPPVALSFTVSLVIERSLALDLDPGVSLVSDDHIGRAHLVDDEATGLKRGLKIAEHLNLADALVRRDVPGMKLAFEVFPDGVAVLVVAEREASLLEFLVLAGIDDAAS
jgi:hypothetical protein